MVSILNWISGLVWNQYFIYCFLGIGLFFTIASRFVQLVHVKEMIKYTFSRESSRSGVSSFQAISMSLGSRMGTGNIAGVATAIALGGPGAVFWMWLMAFLGSATAFIESSLAQIYKSKQNGEYRGGPPYYIEKGLGLKKIAIVYALIAIIAKGFGLMNIQSNTIAVSMEKAFGINPMFMGIILVLFFSLIVFGGIKRIAKATEFFVPLMAIGYLIVCSIILIANVSAIPDVFSLILSSAFGAEATFGGIVGAAISWGVQRGFFSNAAGSGGETYEGAAAEVSHPAKQGFVQAFGVYVDTWIICSATAFMILITGMYNVQPDGQEAIVTNVPGVEAGAVNVQMAVSDILPSFGYIFLAIALFFFCFTTMLSYYYKAETSLAYITRNWKSKVKWMNNLLKFLILIFVFTGTVVASNTAWTIGDIGLGSMAYFNLFALLLLFKPALKVLKDFKEQKKMGKDPVFDPAKLGIKNAEFWEKEYVQDEKHRKEQRKAQ
ncbi:alanine/glycine:cation symporter family protein [Alteribacillus bidgolensis]|uniref:Alanine or glycine:cation symporter, AGCS family n=1 Tax=Alteribacillus bidgolensis TaxID=930129 RepID=A0A1G8JPI6_9BACI|nr:alanine/glycine:cation symporter family protein [Alteribacillus bidgolensis]SDI32490.1 alanine or glycine:cation symporter, AGCS family [Alteribacillus bidgolensis]